jgi:hypothetical protein
MSVLNELLMAIDFPLTYKLQDGTAVRVSPSGNNYLFEMKQGVGDEESFTWTPVAHFETEQGLKQIDGSVMSHTLNEALHLFWNIQQNNGV